jgi:hypothetical protein
VSRDLVSAARQQLNWEVSTMADEILEELWKVKDELSEKCRQMGWQEYCAYLNRTVSVDGFKLVDRSRPPQMMVAEDPVEYKKS